MDEPNGNGTTGSPPAANRAVIELELKRALNRQADRARKGVTNPGKRLLLLRAAPQWRGDDVFTADLGDTSKAPITVCVAACRTVLSVLEALSVARDEGSYLVVLTPCQELGESVLAQAIEPGILPVNRWDLIREAFGTKKLEPSLGRNSNSWLAEALLDAQPVGGWRKLTGPVLGKETAMNSLATVRLGLSADADDTGVDAAALLEWTHGTSAVSSFRKLRDEERNGIVRWLKDSVGPVAEVIFTMVSQDLGDAVPFGLVVAALYADRTPHQRDVLTARGRAEERFFGGHPPTEKALIAFGEAAESLVGRWTDTVRAPDAASLCERAEAILTDLGADQVAAESKVLDAGFDARLAALAEALNSAMPEPTAAKLQPAEAALRQVFDYRRKRTREAEVRAAEAAVRVARWLAAPEDSPPTLADAATRMLRSWGWADRALTVIARADTSRVPRLGGIYAKLWDTATARRGGLDQAFARKLAAWTDGSGTTSDLLLVENVMERIAKPVAKSRLPLVLVLDGMSVAAGCDLAAELTDGGLWLEAGRHEDGREPVLATVPSVTSISRTSLLTGKLRSGGQPEEKAGFAAFWGNQKARLFHKGDLAADPGQRLNPQVRDAILDPDTIVGVVLNTIDDMLHPGRQGNESHWEVDQIAYLKPVLDEARRAGRSVILTADHGHVLDRRRPIHPAQSESARYRTGTPGDGEIAVRGPRVLVPGGEVVAAVDEGIHYLPKKAGYHGGAAPAEVVVPVIVLLPSSSLVPDGWHSYEANGHRPVWWDAPQAEPATPSPVKPSRRPAAAHVEEPDDALFGVRDVMAPAEASQPAPVASKKATASPSSLGSQVVASGRLASQRQFARRAPDDDRIARLIDGLDRAGRKATIGEAARIAGEPAVRMSGYLAQVARLLNVDGYPVIRTIDDGRTVELNTELLKQQFLGERVTSPNEVSSARRREVIDALRRGTVPQAGLDLFAVGMDRFEGAIDDELANVAAGRSTFKAVRGEYGSGKTFFARWLAERAKRRGMAAAEIQISETETPLHRLETVYRRLVEQLSTASYPPSALREIVAAWFYMLEEDVLAERTVQADDADALAKGVDALLERRLADVARTTPAFAAALRAYRNATLVGDQAAAESLIAWIGGQPNVAASARRAAGVRGDLDHFAALGFLQGLLTILRDSGHPGLLVVLDEIETLQRVRSDVRDKGLNALRQLIDDVDSGRFPGLYLLITGTPAFYDGPQGISRLTPLAQRLVTDFGTDARFDSPRAVQVRLSGFDLLKLAKLGTAVRDLYAQGSGAQDRIARLVDDDYLTELARAVAGELGGQVGVAPRIFLRKLVADVLDRVAEFPDFDPRQHYRLTLSGTELTDVERNAAAFRPSSADEVELDL